MILLIIVYREYYPEYPLLPWLLSTEPLEHLFGTVRLIKRDFTYADFLDLVPKALHNNSVFRELSPAQQAREVGANDYTHFKTRGLDLHELKNWPEDFMFPQIYECAVFEAEELMSVLQVPLEGTSAKLMNPHFDFLGLSKPPAKPDAGQEDADDDHEDDEKIYCEELEDGEDDDDGDVGPSIPDLVRQREDMDLDPESARKFEEYTFAYAASQANASWQR